MKTDAGTCASLSISLLTTSSRLSNHFLLYTPIEDCRVSDYVMTIIALYRLHMRVAKCLQFAMLYYVSVDIFPQIPFLKPKVKFCAKCVNCCCERTSLHRQF